MEIIDFLGIFLRSETPFMLLFVSLFFYTVKTNRDREARHHEVIELKLAKLEEEMQVLIRVWKILLEKELENHE